MMTSPTRIRGTKSLRRDLPRTTTTATARHYYSIFVSFSVPYSIVSFRSSFFITLIYTTAPFHFDRSLESDSSIRTC